MAEITTDIHIPGRPSEPGGLPHNIDRPTTGQEETFRLLGGDHDYESLTDTIARVVLDSKIRLSWILFLLLAMTGLMIMIGSVTWVILMGTGVWGINIPVAWGFAIINFVWWIGIGHAGTLISAILLLLHQGWRTSINRFAEAMTLFAVACAALYPLLHIGRHQVFYFMLPLPNTMDLWPQFRSPLIWDVFAVTTYFTVSLLFWYVGLVPDMATLRDRAKSHLPRVVFGALCLGWRNSGKHWHRYMQVYLLLAGLATPLVLSVHSTISFDFAVAQVVGWQSTIFPPFFVAGAVYQGFAMVLILAIPMRAYYGLKDLITMRHLENCAKVMLGVGWIVLYGYIMEAFIGWYSGNTYEQYMVLTTRFWGGPYSWSYWILILCNGILPQLLWFKKIRTNLWWLFLLSIVVSVGMWFERFVIVVLSLYRDYLPSSWGGFRATFWDYAVFLGTFGLFFTLFILFMRFLPVIAISEKRELLQHDKKHPAHEEPGVHVTHGGNYGDQIAPPEIKGVTHDH
jgi:molybdopterin-containing oxidoreductase family membrane subunit